MCGCVCVNTRVPPTRGRSQMRPWDGIYSNVLICLAKKVDHGARGRRESIHRKTKYHPGVSRKTPDTVATVIIPLAKRYLETPLGCWCKLDSRNPDRRKSQLAFVQKIRELLCELPPPFYRHFAIRNCILSILCAILPILALYGNTHYEVVSNPLPQWSILHMN